MTAGELLRRELEKGSSQLALAKRLAGTDDDQDSDVKRWRYVVMRAARGAEPQEDKWPRIAETLGVKKLERPKRAGRLSLEDRLELLSAQLRANQEAGLANQKSTLETQQDLLAELRSLREAVESLSAAVQTPPTRSRRSGR